MSRRSLEGEGSRRAPTVECCSAWRSSTSAGSPDLVYTIADMNLPIPPSAAPNANRLLYINGI